LHSPHLNRSAISDAQQEFSLNAYATASPLDTPMMVPNAAAAKRTGGVAFVGVPDTPSPGPTAAQLATDILLYTNPALTYAVAAGGALVLGMAWFAMRGAHGLTLLSGALLRAAAAWVWFCSALHHQTSAKRGP
jgi:hypothetical protein